MPQWSTSSFLLSGPINNITAAYRDKRERSNRLAPPPSLFFFVLSMFIRLVPNKKFNKRTHLHLGVDFKNFVKQFHLTSYGLIFDHFVLFK